MEFRHPLLQQPPAAACLVVQGIGYGTRRERVGSRAPDQRPHADEVHRPGETVLLPDGQLDDQRNDAEPLLYGRDRLVEIGADAVHLVDEHDARHAVAVGLSPYRLALRFDARDGVEHRDRAVEYAQRALHFVGEVDVSGCVDQVDAVVVPRTADGGGEDGDATVSLLRVVVGDGRALVDLAALVGGPGGVEDPLGDGGLPGVDVGEDAEIADGGRGVQVGAHGPGVLLVGREEGSAMCGREGTGLRAGGRYRARARPGNTRVREVGSPA